MKKITSLAVLALLTLLVAMAISADAANIRQDLAAYWPLNEGTGTTASDVSGNGNDGSLVGASWTADTAPLWGSGANSRKNPFALQFDGLDDQVEVPDSPGLNPGTGLTVAAWIRADPAQPSPDGAWGIVDKSHNCFEPRIDGWTLQGEGDGQVIFAIAGPSAGASGCGSARTVASVLDNAFHHLVGTWDGTVIRMYLDGVLREAHPFSAPAANNTLSLFIGRSAVGISRHFRGIIDDVRIYGVGLSPGQVRSLAHGGGPSQ